MASKRKLFYRTHGTCSQFIELEADEHDILRHVNFIGGCNGNLQGISKLVTGMKLQEIKQKLDGVCCGGKKTSCPDQLCRAIEELEKQV
ncbi:MAG: TIGR03905 family TSCPD domain-containing protein [Bacteroidaceae bacterium]|nr:TIGR03905 family TSCPD domain-containing protein [Bacteroidaceae bacterium]